MSAFLDHLLLTFRQLLKRPGYLSLLLLCPLVLALCLRIMPEEQRSPQLTVGISLPQHSRYAPILLERMASEEDSSVTIVTASEEQVRRQVASGQWCCGYLLPEDLDQRLESGDVEELITVLSQPDSPLVYLLTEKLSAALMELCWDQIALRQLQELGLEPSLPDTLEEALPQSNWVAIITRTADSGGKTRETTETAPDLLPGLLGIWLLAAALLGGLQLRQWLCSSYVRCALPGQGLGLLLLPRLLGYGFSGLLSGGCSLLLLGGTGSGFVSLIVYQLSLCCLMAMLALLPVTEQLIPVVLPITPLAALLTAPVLVDLSRFLPALRTVSQLSPLTGFLVLYRGGASLQLPLTALVLALAALLLARLFPLNSAPVPWDRKSE